MIKVYQKYLISNFLYKFALVTLIFSCLIFMLNIFEEINFFKIYDSGFYYAIVLTLLNIPSVLYEVSPFIFLLTTQLFYLNFHENDEIESLKKFGLNNLKIIGTISIVSLIFGVVIVLTFYSFSAKMKYFYYDIKNKYSEDNKYLAVINSNGLWIKDETINEINFINADSLEGDTLYNVSITKFSKAFKLIENIEAEEADIKTFNWKLINAEISKDNQPKINEKKHIFISNFNTEKLNSLFDTLNSITIWSLASEKDRSKIFRFSPREIDYYLNKLYSYPFLVTIMTIIASIVMVNLRKNTSKFLFLSIGVLISVTIYYLIYFSNSLGETQQFSNFVSIWLPIAILGIITFFGLLKINEK